MAKSSLNEVSKCQPLTDFLKEKRNGRSMWEISKLLGYSGNAYSNWERTGSLPNKREVVDALAKILQTTRMELLSFGAPRLRHRSRTAPEKVAVASFSSGENIRPFLEVWMAESNGPIYLRDIIFISRMLELYKKAV